MTHSEEAGLGSINTSMDALCKERMTKFLRALYLAKYTKNDNMPCEIEQGLFLGSVGAAYNKAVLKSLNITHILVVANALEPAYPNDFKYKQVEVLDSVDTNLEQHFEECFSFIDEAKREGAGVLVHCFAGRSRSVTIVVAYLMRTHHISLSQSLELVRSKRPQAAPNQGFLLQLQNFENHLTGRSFARRTGNFISVKMANPRASIKEDRFLYEWLTGSSHGRSVIQRAEIFGRKKVSRRSRHGGSSGRDADEENTNMEAQQRLRQHLQVSNRRYCRYVNDRLLREMAPPLNVEEIGKLFAPPPWGERNVLTPFERVTGAGEDSLQDMAAWEPFRNNVDMDKEAQILEVSTRHRPKKDERDLTGIMAAMKAWSTVERRSREALRQHFNSSLVEAFEERILAYAKNAEYGEGLTLEVENPFHRLLLHGICEFYGLVSKTVSKWEDTDGGFRLATKTYIRKKRQSKNSNSGELVQMKIVHFLSIVKNAVPNCEAAA